MTLVPKKKGNQPFICCEARDHYDEADRETLQCGIVGSRPNSILITNVLIDTGALQGNYISEEMANKILGSSKPVNAGNTMKVNKRRRVVCSPISDSCMTIIDNIEVALNFESCNSIKTCLIEFNVLPSLSGSQYDVIVGEKSIIE